MLSLQWRLVGALDRIARLLAPQPSPPGSVPVLPPSQPALPKPAPPAAPAAPVPTPVVDQGLVNFIKKTEAFSSKAYWDYKQYSIGWGTKANSATEVIDEAEATRRLTVEINLAEQEVEKVAANAPKGVKQALTDLTYNAGFGWSEHSLGAAVKAQKWDNDKT